MNAALIAAVWISFATVLTPRQEVAVTTALGKMYLIGGIQGRTVLTSVEEYDPLTNRWRFIAPLPAPRHHAAAAAIGNSIYVIGGYETILFDEKRTVFRYDIAADQWTQVADLAEARGALAAVAINGKIYAVGGTPGGRALTVYDPAINSWRTLPDMPTPREHLAAAAANGVLFVAGGRMSENTNAFECYEPDFDRWTILPHMATARGGIAAATLKNRIYVFGGEGNPATPSGVFEQTESVDLATFTWRTETPMPHPRHGLGAAAIGNFIFVPAGAPIQGFGTSSVNDAITEELPPRRRSVRH